MAAEDDIQEKDRAVEAARRALVERVLASPSLQRAPRLRELFRYLCECAIQSPQAHITEQQIGVAVFERAAGYDTNADTIVRVQVSQLRRKVDHHFLSDGKDEPVVIEVPKGSYLPLFRSRPEGEIPALVEAVPAAGAPPRWWRHAPWLVALLAVLASVLIVRSRAPGRGARETPHLDRFWRQLTEGHGTQVVLSDVGAAMLADLLERPITLDEYLQRGYPTIVLADVPLAANVKSLLQQAAVKGYGNAQDAAIAHAVAVACDRQAPVPGASVVSARYLKLDLARAESLVLLGNRRSNPWLSVFDRDLAFKYAYDEVKHMARFENKSPQAGEEPSYAVEWGRKGHCLVAYLPKPRGEGSVLLISGTDWVSGTAGGQFMTDESSVAGLYQRLGTRLSERLPYFELLLQAELTGTATTTYRVVAHRVVTPTPAPRQD